MTDGSLIAWGSGTPISCSTSYVFDGGKIPETLTIGGINQKSPKHAKKITDPRWPKPGPKSTAAALLSEEEVPSLQVILETIPHRPGFFS